MTATLTPPSVDNDKRNVVLYMAGSGQFAPAHQFVDGPDGPDGKPTKVLKVTGMPVFRTGSFKDSMGDLNTWETLHIEQMKSTFDFLKGNSVLPEVPVRRGHGSFFGDPMTGLIGYHDALYTQDAHAPDGQMYKYLLADFSIHDSQAQVDYVSGLLRNRSSEVGYFESNEGTGYYPVFQGFAFVDIPAVQYLNLFGQNKQRSFSVLLEREIDMPGAATTTAPASGTAVVDPDGTAAHGENSDAGAGASATDAGNGTGTEGTDAGNSGDGGAGASASKPPDPVVPPVPSPAAPVAPTPTEGASQNSNSAQPTFEFTCDTRKVTDFAAVQSYITSLETSNKAHETYRNEQNMVARKNFVQKLSDDKKIMASQVESLTEHALSLDEKQFDSFKVTYDKSPVIPLFAYQTDAADSTPGQAELSEDERNFESACARVVWHRAANMLDEDLKNTESYKMMERLADKLGKDKV